MDEITQLEHAMKQFRKLVKLDAPPVIKAHYLTNILIPRVVIACNIVDEFAGSLGDILARGLGSHCGMCQICRKVRVFPNDICPKCSAQMDQVEAEMNSPD